jgi:hypothetical protein
VAEVKIGVIERPEVEPRVEFTVTIKNTLTNEVLDTCKVCHH